MRYLVPQFRISAEIKVKNSRFIGTLDYCPDADSARKIIQSLRNEMTGANHHVYAFRAGYGASVVEGLSDDGEPSGTSGPPVMAVLRGSDIGDAIIVVSRFFGGTKLGTGGLVSAYKKTAQEVIENAVLTEKIEWKQIQFEIDYSLLEKIKLSFDEFEITEVKIDYQNKVIITAQIPVEGVETFDQYILNMTSGNSSLIFV